jgi:hypothetical protein
VTQSASLATRDLWHRRSELDLVAVAISAASLWLHAVVRPADSSHGGTCLLVDVPIVAHSVGTSGVPAHEPARRQRPVMRTSQWADAQAVGSDAARSVHIHASDDVPRVIPGGRIAAA